MVLKALTWSGLKKHYSLIPLLVITGSGMLMAVIYPLRLALKHPEVSWDKRNNLEPFQRYENKKYKFISKYDYSKKSERPVF